MVLEGTWFVLATNFPMWTKGRRTQPRFVYAGVRTVRGQECFDDTVEYVEGGRSRTIVGVDTQLGPGRYQWRGKGWLWFFTSRWEIRSVSPDEQSLVISFEKTWATPAGFDVISRTKTLADPSYAALVKAIGSPALTRLTW